MLSLLFSVAMAAEPVSAPPVDADAALVDGNDVTPDGATPSHSDYRNLEVAVPRHDDRLVPDTSLSGWERVPYPMGISETLATYNVDADHAAVLSAAMYDGARGNRLRIQEVSLGGGHVATMADTRAQRVCTNVPHTPWRGPGEVRTFTVSSIRHEQQDIDATSIVMVVGHPEVGSVVAVSPGDTVEVRRVSHDDHVTREIVTVEHLGASLVLDRQANSARVCYQHAIAADEQEPLIALRAPARHHKADDVVPTEETAVASTR